MATVTSRIVEACIFKLMQGEPRYLMLKRSAQEKLYPGIWQIVTGNQKDGEHAVHAALREVREETGLRPLRMWAVPYIVLSYNVGDDTVHVSPLFAIQVSESDEPKISSEHQDHGWYDSEKSKSLLVWPSQKQGLQLIHEYIVGGLEAGRLTEIEDFSYFERKR